MDGNGTKFYYDLSWEWSEFTLKFKRKNFLKIVRVKEKVKRTEIGLKIQFHGKNF